MRRRIARSCMLMLLLGAGLLLPASLSAQRGTLTVPRGCTVTVPSGARLCADTIFANGTGHGTLTLADPTGVCSGSIVIPVELLSFSAVLQDGAVSLAWTTATESGNYGFEVQRQAGQNMWQTLGFVEGRGSSTETRLYRFTDPLADLPGEAAVLRYRLRQIDLDGQFEYSPEVEVTLDVPLPRFALDGYPTPCDDVYTLRLTLAEPRGMSIRLLDMAGRVLRTVTKDAAFPAGSHSLRLRTANIPSGLYLLVAESATERRSVKIVIRR